MISTSTPTRKAFSDHFQIVPAVNDELKRHTYRLRHKVYCHELGYEPVVSDEIEQDEYDRNSVHCLIRAIEADRFIGCARLILTDPHNPHAPLPFERNCATVLDREIVDPAQLDRHKIAEISRLAVLDQYRRRKVEREPGHASPSKVRLPFLTLGIYLGLLALATYHGIEKVFLLAENCLAKSIGRQLGVEVVRIGNPIEHRGERIPYMIDVGELLSALDSNLSAYYEKVRQEVLPSLEHPLAA